MALYSYKGQYPTQLPKRIRLSNGFTRTDPSTFTSDEIADAGYVMVSDKPVVDSTKTVEWNSETIAWAIRDKTEQELQNERKIVLIGKIEDAKRVVRTKLAEIYNPVTNSPMSVETSQELIERDLEHSSANQTMILNQPVGGMITQELKDAILTSQAKGIAVLLASKQVYAMIAANLEYDYVNSDLWPQEIVANTANVVVANTANTVG